MIGLVGGIGSGKSAVASLLAEKGASVLDADAIGHALLDQRPQRDKVVERFGTGVLSASPGGDSSEVRVDRSVLGTLVFSDPTALRDLEAILHPAMKRTMEKAAARANRAGKAPAIVIDAAILFEAGWHALCDLVVFVETDANLRRSRVLSDRGWSAEQLEARERAQRPEDYKKERSDFTVRNDGDLEALRENVRVLWDRFLETDPPADPGRSRGSSIARPASRVPRGLSKKPAARRRGRSRSSWSPRTRRPGGFN